MTILNQQNNNTAWRTLVNCMNAYYLYQTGAYGNGNGTTTFNVPDLRGVFVRGYNSGGSNNGSASATLMETHSYQYIKIILLLQETLSIKMHGQEVIVGSI